MREKSNRESHSQVQKHDGVSVRLSERRVSNARVKCTPIRASTVPPWILQKMRLDAFDFSLLSCKHRMQKRGLCWGQSFFSLSPERQNPRSLRPVLRSYPREREEPLRALPFPPHFTNAGSVVMSKTSSRSTSAVSRTKFGSASKKKKPLHVPLLVLDSNGTIQHLNEPAHRTLEYPTDASVNSCFFSHVHGHNLRRVMRDLALMVDHRKQRARWLLRLRTGNGRWRWYRLSARNHLDQKDDGIRIRLRPL